MTRPRRPDDWERDVNAAREVEERVATALGAHPQISHLSNFTAEHDELDFRFRFEGADTRVDVKEKRSRLSSEFRELWPEVPEAELLIVDETCLRTLLWEEGLGYLLVRDVPEGRWHVFGPWELALGPRRRFERRGDKGAGEFLKGKLLFDLRTAAATTTELSVGALLDVVRDSRRALRQVRAVSVRGRDVLPVIPRPVPAQTAASREHVSVEGDPAWVGLDAALVAAIRRKLGWDAPTAVQRAAFPPILQGRNVLVLAPTAGGKTEAALLPLLDIQRREGWGKASILCVSPLRALLDDQLARYRNLAALTGATAFAWHGDVGRDNRRGFRDSPTDILLTTPESLEGLLSRPGDSNTLLAGLQAVIVDEVHSFAGTPRGAQLASLLERLDRVVGPDLQRVGLSATVGNPDEVLSWLSGGSLRDRTVADAGPPMHGEDLELIACSSMDEVTTVIREVAAASRALVFTTSRRRAEEIGNTLAAPVHHSSLSAEQRDAALAALRSGRVPCIVATASLEMGIDIGEVELVVHDGAPSTPGSYLQRLGRAGRRSGERRMVFTVSTPDELLLVLAVVARARRGDVGAIPPGRGARLVLGQQALALAFQQTVPRRSELREALRWSPAFRDCIEDVEPTLEHLLANGWLTEVGDQVVVGPKAHERFGGRGFIGLMATFQADAGVRVVDDAGRAIGSLDWARVVDEAGEVREGGFVLAGKTWELAAVDRAAGTATVRPGGRGRAPSWRGPALEVERPTWEAAREVLLATDVPLAMDAGGRSWLAHLREEWAPKLDLPVEAAAETTFAHAFAGDRVHRAVLAALPMEGTADGPTLAVRGTRDAVTAAALSALERFDEIVEEEAERQVKVLSGRHLDLSAPSVLLAEARQFHVDAEGMRAVLELLAGG